MSSLRSNYALYRDTMPLSTKLVSVHSTGNRRKEGGGAAALLTFDLAVFSVNFAHAHAVCTGPFLLPSKGLGTVYEVTR